jgi:hypothetical protein
LLIAFVGWAGRPLQTAHPAASVTLGIPVALWEAQAMTDLDGAFSSTSEDSIDILSARIEALALEASLPVDSAVTWGRFRLNSGSEVLGIERLIRVLVDAGKPLRCSAAESIDHISISCHELRAGPEFQEHASFVIGMESEFGIGGMFIRQKIDVDSSLLIVSRNASLLVPLRAFQRWYQEYLLPPNCSLGARRPEAAELRLGASHVIVVSRNDQLDPAGLPLKVPPPPDGSR